MAEHAAWADQAVFTSLLRRGRAGYHVVARSAGVSEADVRALTAWSPSHGALQVDPANRASVNFHAMPDGRYAVSRTCEGPPEYSGRGGRQLYTHALILDPPTLAETGYQPISVYRDAMALGYLRYQAEPPAALQRVRLSALHPRREGSEWIAEARELGLPTPQAIATKLLDGQSIRFTYAGDRLRLAECLLGILPPEAVAKVSFATSLQPSAVRPFRLLLVGERSDPEAGAHPAA